MTIDTQKLRRIARLATSDAIRLTPSGAEEIIHAADHIDAQAAQLAAYPADWREDSSLGTWFPVTAAKLQAQKVQIDGLRHELEYRSAYCIRHKGSLLACSDPMREAYSDEKVRADAADVALREAAEVINDRNAEIERLRAALTTIKEWPITSPLDMDAHNMQVVAHAALSGEEK